MSLVDWALISIELTMKTRELKKLAAIEYLGTAGITSHCVKSIAKLIHFGDKINSARILSCKGDYSGTHGFILDVNCGVEVAVKSGFTSGYPGEGPRGLSTVLQLLSRHGAEIEEFEVGYELIERLNYSCLLRADIDSLVEKHAVRPRRWYDYIYEFRSLNTYDNSLLRGVFPVVVPFELIDFRLMDLALKFESEPDSSINTAYRRLEDLVRNRADLNSDSGSRLFSKAFQGDKSVLYWQDNDGGEHNGKASLFTSVFNAYRNRRAHRELKSELNELMREFLLINELYLLEGTAVVRPVDGHVE